LCHAVQSTLCPATATAEHHAAAAGDTIDIINARGDFFLPHLNFFSSKFLWTKNELYSPVNDSTQNAAKYYRE